MSRQKYALNLDGSMNQASFIEGRKRINAVFCVLIGEEGANYQIIPISVSVKPSKKKFSTTSPFYNTKVYRDEKGGLSYFLHFSDKKLFGTTSNLKLILIAHFILSSR